MRHIRSVQVNGDSIDLTYFDEDDVRVEGNVIMTHHLNVGRHSNYDDEMDKLEAAAEDLLTDVLTDFVASPAYHFDGGVPEDDDDDEDERWRQGAFAIPEVPK
jgi:hypothetical protein